MKLNFCTLFNINYLSRGIALYRSLERNCADFHLYVFAFDDATYHYLSQASYKNLTPVSLQQFEDEKLLAVKPGRTAAEYCWTCTASTILYSIKKFALENCTYIDADMLFYDDPSILVNEMGDKDVLITRHNYTPAYDQSAESGIYCVQFVTFKNTVAGLHILAEWRNNCIDWCYARPEDGKFGDQKYLDEWPVKYKEVHIAANPGAGIAPWNLQQYEFVQRNGKIVGIKKESGKHFPVIFFHFHGLKLFKNNAVSFSGNLYRITKKEKAIFYWPYLSMLNNIRKEMECAGYDFNPEGSLAVSPQRPFSFFVLAKLYLSALRQALKNNRPANFGEVQNYYHTHYNNMN